MTELAYYEPPTLEPITYTAVTKHLTADISVPGSANDKYDIEALLETYGSPLFVVSEPVLRDLYRRFAKSFSDPEIDTQVAYSYKTNYLPAICSIMHEEGALAEIVSGMEYSLAGALGVPPSRVIFNGPYKEPKDLERALLEGAIVNVDNFAELSQVEQIAAGCDTPREIGIRVSFKYGVAPWTKFGFNFENGDAFKALQRIAAHPKLELKLLHNHSGTFQLIHDIYGQATEVLIKVAREARRLGLKPTMIDLGGGYPSANQLKPEYDLPGGSVRKDDMLTPYADAIISRLRKAKDLFGGRPTLVLEPGRAVVDTAVDLLARVVALKQIPNQGKAVIVDAGVNLVPTACWYDHHIDASTDAFEGGSSLETVAIYGPLCMQIDVLRNRALVPPLHVGDPIVISNVGAYCQTQSMQFIHTRPATVLLGPDGPELIRRAEEWSDFFVLDKMPERLRPDGFSL
ncbi:MAG: diaminopimelate decarboxylase [Alphaproteobacteria bacterium]|nr:diaminopimelate decarboxylase [Alphaproteobacteria bacterium]